MLPAAVLQAAVYAAENSFCIFIADVGVKLYFRYQPQRR